MFQILFLIGNHVEDKNIIPQLLDLEKYPKKPEFRLAAPESLILWDCHYPDNIKFEIPTEKSHVDFYNNKLKDIIF